jgi:hypothetical protein
MGTENCCHRLQLVYLRRSRSGWYQQNSVSAKCQNYPRSLHGKNKPFLYSQGPSGRTDGVLVSGCHPGECHYISGNLVARRKFATLKSFLNYIGMEGDRTMFTWVSASEGDRFAQVIKG